MFKDPYFQVECKCYNAKGSGIHSSVATLPWYRVMICLFMSEMPCPVEPNNDYTMYGHCT